MKLHLHLLNLGWGRCAVGWCGSLHGVSVYERLPVNVLCLGNRRCSCHYRCLSIKMLKDSPSIFVHHCTVQLRVPQ